MQQKELSEPADPRTINLLPSNLVDKYKTKKSKIQVWSLTLTITLYVWTSFLIVLASYLVISQQITSLKNKNQNKAHIEKARLTYEQESKSINEVADKVVKIENSYTAPETVLNIISSSKPADVNLNKYQIDFEKGTVNLFGIADKRETLINFKQNLETVEKISNVNIPISSYEQEVNLEFSLSFNYGQQKTPKTKPVPNTVK